MKRCPECRKDYLDDSLSYCLDDGAQLVQGSVTDEPATAILHETAPPSEAATRVQIHTTDKTAVLPSRTAKVPKAKSFDKRLLLAPLALAIIVIGGFFGYRYFGSANTNAITSIAVLPFQNKSGDPNTEYLSDGLAESLIYRLSQLPDLKVSPTSSVFRYKGKETDPQVVAGELGVDSVMTGRIIQRGDSLNISVNLVDTRRGKSLWGEQYERKMSELLQTQREIVAEITNKLKLRLSGENEQKLAKKYTDSSEAYQLYLKGRFYWNKRDPESLRKATEQFRAAAESDPNFALAYVGLADCYSLFQYFPGASDGDLLQARVYAERALAIDDSLGEAHTSLGLVHSLQWNWTDSAKEFRRGIELNPNYATGHQWYGRELLSLGRVDDALIALRRASELEPLSAAIRLNFAQALLAHGDINAAFDEVTEAAEISSNWYFARILMGVHLVKQGRLAEALVEAEKGVELSGRQAVALGILGYVHGQMGKRREAETLIEELKKKYSQREANGYDLARVYVGLGDNDQAFAWLEKDFESRNATMPREFSLFPLDSLRDDPRYKDLSRRMNLPE